MEDRCVCCGEIIPEGRQVCSACENKREREDNLIKDGFPITNENRDVDARPVNCAVQTDEI